MLGILHFDQTPWVHATPNFLSFHFECLDRGDDREWHCRLQLTILNFEFFVFVRIAFGNLIDLKMMLPNLIENLFKQVHIGVNRPNKGCSTYILFHLNKFFVRKCISLGNDWNNVHFVMQSFHTFNVQWFQSLREEEGMD